MRYTKAPPTAVKYSSAFRLMIPLAKSWKYVPAANPSSARSSAGLNVPTAGLATMSAAQNSAPRMNPMVAFRVNRDASMPTAINAAPMNQ